MLRQIAPNIAVFWLGLVFLVSCAAWLSARRRGKARYPQLLYGFASTIKAALFSRQGFWVFAASAAATALLALTGLDWTLQRFLQQNEPFGNEVSRFFLVWGNFWHVGAAFLLLAWARLRALRPLFTAAAAAAQALLIQVVVVTGLKFLTGRRGPANPDRIMDSAYFRKTSDPADFAFDFWSNGFFDGRFFWPSGHTATAFSFAAAFTFALSWRDAGAPLRVFAALLWILAAFTALAMVDGDFHWTSDVLAGAAIGTLLGAATGRSFRKRYPA